MKNITILLSGLLVLSLLSACDKEEQSTEAMPEKTAAPMTAAPAEPKAMPAEGAASTESAMPTETPPMMPEKTEAAPMMPEKSDAMPEHDTATEEPAQAPELKQ
ncbi:MAG: hypothetical protein WC782_03680 [Methylococcaceae bacterium]|jgi:hypothetical protein